MREILFRGKRIDNGKWHYGSYLFLKDAPSYDWTGTEVGSRKDVHFIIDDKDMNLAVNKETVCQYTGLTDKNGRRYEGDIFQASDGDYIQRYIITWNEDSLEWSAECIGDPEGTLPLSEFRVSEIEVIGNIYDNPELIGGQP